VEDQVAVLDQDAFLRMLQLIIEVVEVELEVLENLLVLLLVVIQQVL
jgi:hypothetical protein